MLGCFLLLHLTSKLNILKAYSDFTYTYKHIHTMFDKATLSLGTTNEISKVALMAGSSQQGKALRASVALRKKYEIQILLN